MTAHHPVQGLSVERIPMVSRRKWIFTVLAAPLAGCQATLAPLLKADEEASRPVLPIDPPLTEAQRVQAVFEQALPNTLAPGDVIRKTRYEGVWAIDNILRPTLPRYFDDKGHWFVNVPKPVGLQGLSDAVAKDAVEGRRRAMAQQIDVSQWILIQHRSRPVAVVYGAYDCPYSRMMEADMARAGFSYYLIPRGLNAESTRRAREAFTSVDPLRAWRDLLARGQSAVPGAANRVYPERDAIDIAFLFMSGKQAAPTTPQVIFADGGTLVGWETAKSMPFVHTRIKQKTFFG